MNDLGFLAGEKTHWSNSVPIGHQTPGCGTVARDVPVGARLQDHQQRLGASAAAGRDSSMTLALRPIRRRRPLSDTLARVDNQHQSTAPMRAGVSGGRMEGAPPRTASAKRDPSCPIGHQAGLSGQSSPGESLRGRANKMCRSSQRSLVHRYESRRSQPVHGYWNGYLPCSMSRLLVAL